MKPSSGSAARTEAVIPILQAIQTHYRYLPREAIERVCRLTDITPAAIVGVSTFYTQFRHRPVGQHIISVCHGTACHVKGAELVQDALERHLDIARGSDTDPEGLFTIEKVACLGCCTLAPVVQIDGVTYGHLNSHRAGEVIDDFLAQDSEGRPVAIWLRPCTTARVGEIRVGLGSCCVAQGSGKVHRSHRPHLGRQRRAGRGEAGRLRGHVPPDAAGGTDPARRRAVATVRPRAGRRCPGHRALAIPSPRRLWRRIGHRAAGWLDRLLSDETADPVGRARDRRPRPAGLRVPRAAAARGHRVLRPARSDRSGRVSAARRLRGPAALPGRALARASHRAGPGRAGCAAAAGPAFPPAQKWATVRAAAGEKKYVICNGDEGDPGAFMDRMLLESFPYRIIEGMAIAAQAVGADEGIFYIRAEYPLAVEADPRGPAHAARSAACWATACWAPTSACTCR